MLQWVEKEVNISDGVSLSNKIRRSGNINRHLVSGPGEYAVCSFVGVKDWGES